jgi:hypothetical protein
MNEILIKKFQTLINIKRYRILVSLYLIESINRENSAITYGNKCETGIELTTH